jgi:hypothetical protein
MARREALRLFPEFKHGLVQMQVFLAQYAEIDWETGRSIVVKQRRRSLIPASIAAKAKPKLMKRPQIDEEETE